MIKYHTIMMHANAVMAVLNLLFGVWYGKPQFFVFFAITAICSFISYAILEESKNDNRSKRNH